MKIFEVISLSHHTTAIESSIHVGILNAIRVLVEEQGSHAKSEEHANYRNDLEPLIAELTPIFNKELKAALQRNLLSVIRKFSKTGRGTEFTNIWFKPMKELGYADRGFVYLNDQLSTSISRIVLDTIHEIVLDNAYDEFGDKFYEYAATVARTNNRFQAQLFDAVGDVVTKITKTIVHELVHTKQHSRQAGKNIPNFEYRSYLDKHKGQFYNMPDNNSQEYWNLYLASPQEIAAWSHSIVVDMIKTLGLDKITDPTKLQRITSDVLVSYIDKFLQTRYKNPANPKEYSVYKRYLKLVYQELESYLDKIRNRS